MRNTNNLKNKHSKKKLAQRLISLLLVLVLVNMTFFENFPYKNLNLGVTSTVVQAAEESGVDDDDPDYKHDADNNISIRVDQLVSYSENAVYYHKYHQNDKIRITASSGNTTFFTSGFKGLGTSQYPFAGSIEIANNALVTLNLDAPLFNYVFDTVTINNNNFLNVARYYDTNKTDISRKTPLIASNIVHSGNGGATWNINVTTPSHDSDAVLSSFGGMIGTVGDEEHGAVNVTVNVKLDQVEGDTNDIELDAEGDAGIVCGSITNNSTLNFNFISTENVTNRKISKVTTSSGNIGGLAGTVESGSTFNYSGINYLNGGASIKTDNGYAGGIVGENSGSVFVVSTSQYRVTQAMEGTLGAGGIYGHYIPATADIIYTDTYFIDCQVNGSGYDGGLFGVLESTGVTILPGETDNTVKSNHASGSASAYGGLVGKLSADSLAVGAVKVNTSKGGSAAYYGGGIGKIVDTATVENEGETSTVNKSIYSSFNGTQVTSSGAGSLTYGGLVAKADRTFVDSKGVKITADGFKGGALIGSLSYGVLRMSGTTDLTDAKSSAPGDGENIYVGQIVGYRDDALVFTEGTINRYSSVEVDDIGSWGEVLVFTPSTNETTGVTTESMGGNSVLSINETSHIVSVVAPSDTTKKYKLIANVADYAKTALCFQIDASNNAFIEFADSSSTFADILSETIELSSDLSGSISLAGTGLTGLTRDNDISSDASGLKCTFTGTFKGNNKTISFATGEPNGNVYRHLYNGLFAITNGANIQNTTFDGYIHVKANSGTMYAGAVAGAAKGSFSVSDNTVNTAFTHAGGKALNMGGLLGEALLDITSITVSETTIACNMTGTSSAGSNFNLGGVIGKVSHASNSDLTWSFSDIDLSGTISSTWGNEYNHLGGLIAVINSCSIAKDTETLRKLNLSDIDVSNLTISASKTGSGDSSKNTLTLGGILGYSWYNVHADFDQVSIAGSSLSLDNIKSESGNMAGLVYAGSGYWTVKDADDIDITSLNVTAANAKSFGGFINQAWNSSDKKITSALYLELQNSKSLKLGGLSFGDSTFTVYDEIAAYTSYPNDANDGSAVLENGQSVISIKTDVTKGLNMSSGTASHSYVPQTSLGNTPNNNTRYYYNLDSIRTGTTDPEKLMRWGINTYAHSSIGAYFPLAEGFTSSSIPTGTYTMDGYSWYPVDVSTLSVAGTFGFNNKEFENKENTTFAGTDATTYGTHSYDRTSLYDSTNSTTTQHYLLHAGLIRNVSSNLTVGAVTLQGNTGLIGVLGAEGSGMLVCGTVKKGSATKRTKVTINGQLSLNGAYISGIGADTYAPLVINQADDYVDFVVKNVRTSNAYESMTASNSPGLYVSSGAKAASSLIGKLGISDSPTGENITFSDIRLDGRTSDVTDSSYNTELTKAFGTSNTIFTKATLLYQYKYQDGSEGRYDFTWAEDWKETTEGSGTYTHANLGVTYGKELGYVTNPQGDIVNEYPAMERNYTGDKGNFTNPIDGNDLTGTYQTSFLTGFIPYVYSGYNINDKYHQLMVNHTLTSFGGCGTYNDPYLITKPEEYNSMVALQNGSYAQNAEVILPYVSGNHTESTSDGVTTITNIKNTVWCAEKKENSSHITFKCSSVDTDNNTATFTATVGTGDDAVTYSISGDEVRKYLSGAYYQFTKSMTINATSGFGKNATEILNNGKSTETFNNAFHGVIYGSNFTVTLTGTAPLIQNSTGSVVKNLTVVVSPSDAISRSGNKSKFPTENSYGSIISCVLGGDNIIDNVSVSFSNTARITLTGSDAQLVPVGGYIGVIERGAVIFRGMDSNNADDIQGIPRTSEIVQSGAETRLISKDITETVDDKTVTTTVDNMKWLYVNPIIGRVINGYAVTESTVYRPYEDGTRTYKGGVTDEVRYWDEANQKEVETEPVNLRGVTMQNGTKHYSIADINKNNTTSLNRSSSTISDAQGFYILSLLVNSGENKKKLGFNQTNQISRWADYSAVGTGVPATEKPEDYTLTNSDNSSNVGWLRHKYVGTEGYDKTTITLSADGFYALPDGYKGIGSLFLDEDNFRLSITNFTGNGSKISLNSSYYYYYTKDDDKGTTKVYTNKEFDSNYKNIKNVGFGLFNYQKGKTSSDSSKYYNFTLTGNVICDCIDNKSGNHIPYYCMDTTTKGYSDNGVDRQEMISAGMLMGTSMSEQYLDSVAVLNINVRGVKIAGGLIGWIPGSKTTYKNSLATASEKIRVYSGASAGGMIGKSYNGMIDIDNNNATYSITEIYSYCENRTGNDYNYGVGGFVGMCRCSNSQNNSNRQSYVKISNVVVGEKTAKTASTVKCNDDCIGGIITGGLIGMQNKATLYLDNCKVYNQSVTSPYSAGGLIGYIASTSTDGETNPDTKKIYNVSVISNTEIYSNDDAKAVIKCTGHTAFEGNDSSKQPYYVAAGGFMGAVKHENGNVIIQNSLVEGYTIESYEISGGIVGVFGQYPSNGGNAIMDHRLELDNIKVKNCEIKATNTDDNSLSYAGGLLGILYYNTKTTAKIRSLYGYNILAENLTISANYNGYICGYRNNDTYCIVKIAGFSRQDSRNGNNNKMISNLVGKVPSNKLYGNDGYVVFADYNDSASSTSITPTKLFSNISTAGTNVDTMRFVEKSTTEKENWPFVTNNPFFTMWTDNDVAKYLTGDGVQGLTFRTSRFYKIQSDIAAGNVPKAYTTAPALSGSSDEEDIVNRWKRIEDNYSTAAKEFADYSGGRNFPLLVVSDTDDANLTQQINDYIKTLTNTDFDYANVDTAICEVGLHKCTFNTGTKIWTVDTGTYSANLKCQYKQGSSSVNVFHMDPAKVDSGADSPQFTLIDVKYKDPSGSGNIAYHLYIPVYVKKVIQYNFHLSYASNTDYYKSAYKMDANTLFENLGNPVTLEFEYEYTRTADEWKVAINGGDSVLTNYYKSLHVNMHGNTWPAGTRLALVDAGNHDKVWYMDTPSLTGNYLHLYDFTDDGSSDGDYFTPGYLNNLMSVTVGAPASGTTGTLVLCTNQTEAEALAEGATVLANNNKYYRPASDEELENSGVEKLTVTGVTFTEGSAYLTTTNRAVERYYLTILTKTDVENNNIYHIEVTSKDKFDKSLTDKWTGTDAWRPNKINVNRSAHLYLGNLFDNTINMVVDSKKSGVPLLDGENNLLKIYMTATIKLKDTAVTNRIYENMLDAKDYAEIYQTFLMTYDKVKVKNGQSEFGISPDAGVMVGSDYTYYIQAGESLVKADAISIKKPSNEEDVVEGFVYADKPDIGENYIEFRNNQNLIPYLYDSSNNYAATLRVDYELVYNGDALGAQFPKNENQDNEIGSRVIGYSNIGSSEESAAYSKTSKEKIDSTRYYTSDDSVAKFEYNVVQTEGELPGPYSYLGKNAIELEDKTDKEAQSLIDSYAVYDTNALRVNNDYIEYTLTISSRDNGYIETQAGVPDNNGKGLVISDYLTDLTFYGADTADYEDNPLYIYNKSADNTATASVSTTQGNSTVMYDTDGTTVLAKVTVTNDGKLMKIRVHKSLLGTQGTGVYLLPVTYKVKTGDGYKATIPYSNYKVNLTAATYSDMTTNDYFSASYVYDHIIYTNTRLDADIP